VSWNYRIVKFVEPGEEPLLELREVYYDSTGGLKAHGRATLSGTTFNELHDELRRIDAALKLPALDAKHFPGA
jgi:hypothetical protein